ncbi:MAG: ATP-binding protein [Candidatus Methanoperedens sp.]|nr:ATP-binding protein [Candidatus Methanoperedens sp.]
MEERHRLLLIKHNPWWKGEIPKYPEFKRDLLENILKYAGYKQIIAITGLRRIGKTTLLKQVIRTLEVPKNNICYISFDDIDFQKYEIAEDLINYFLEYSDKNTMRYLFLDEVQKLPNWADLLKTYYDTEDNLKILISGSASLELNQNKETLAGRILTFDMPVLSFSEFVRYYGMEPGFKTKDLFREYDLKFAGNKEKYKELFEDYLWRGAFPELLENSGDREFIKKYIKESVIEKAIIDIARITGENEKIIYELFRLLANSNAQLFEIVNLSQLLKVNRNQVSNYINLLEKSFLINISYNFTKSVAKQVRTNKKQYLAHSSLVMALLDYPVGILNTEAAGYLVESVVANSIENGGFWRSPQKDEVDIVTKDKIPIEVKYQSQITNSDLKSLLKFCNKFGADKGIIVTKNLLERREIDGREILLIPVWVFLLYRNSMVLGDV